jgi:hypothetical protein
MRSLWRVPGLILGPGYVIWAVATSFLSGVIGGSGGQNFAAVVMVLPYFVWINVASHALRFSGRPWWGKSLAPVVLAFWIAYPLFVDPFLRNANNATGGSESLLSIVGILFSVSIILVYDQVSFALPRAEDTRGQRQAGYFGTLLQLLFPPIALWIVHSRISSLLGAAVSPDD